MNRGADPLVRSLPPGRLAAGGKHLPWSEERVQGTRADQGVCPTIFAEFSQLEKRMAFG